MAPPRQAPPSGGLVSTVLPFPPPGGAGRWAEAPEARPPRFAHKHSLPPAQAPAPPAPAAPPPKPQQLGAAGAAGARSRLAALSPLPPLSHAAEAALSLVRPAASLLRAVVRAAAPPAIRLSASLLLSVMDHARLVAGGGGEAWREACGRLLEHEGGELHALAALAPVVAAGRGPYPGAGTTGIGAEQPAPHG